MFPTFPSWGILLEGTWFYFRMICFLMTSQTSLVFLMTALEVFWRQRNSLPSMKREEACTQYPTIVQRLSCGKNSKQRLLSKNVRPCPIITQEEPSMFKVSFQKAITMNKFCVPRKKFKKAKHMRFA
eukprot:PhF_6_TR40758/c0_g1_i1/m.61404